MALKMRLYEFINAYILKNTSIRIWRPVDLASPYGIKMLLTERPIMEWEAKKIPLIRGAFVFGVTDIVCETDREAVNVVILTQTTPEEVSKAIADYREKEEKERRCLSDGC